MITDIHGVMNGEIDFTRHHQDFVHEFEMDGGEDLGFGHDDAEIAKNGPSIMAGNLELDDKKWVLK